MGELALPEAAPLVYSTIDLAAARAADGAEPKRDKKESNEFKSSSAFVADYLDRRAQAEYAGKYSGSKLSTPADPNKRFASRFTDPNHPVNSGSIVALFSGGTFDPKARTRTRRAERKARLRGQELLTEEENNNNVGMRRGVGRGRDGKGRGSEGLVKRVLAQVVLYLLIVNLPSESEMREASQSVEIAQQ